MSMALPTHTKVLIVGGGPVGLTAALTFLRNGFLDFVIVDASNFEVSPESKATTLHAGTLEVLDTLGVTQDLLDIGLEVPRLTICDRNKSYISADFRSLNQLTRFPCMTIIPQNTTERILNDHIVANGGQVFRPYKAISMSHGVDGVDVVFETGEHLTATYIVAADGASSTIRHMCDVGFEDPDPSKNSRQGFRGGLETILADVVLSSSDPSKPLQVSFDESTMITYSRSGFCLAIPFSKEYLREYSASPNDRAYRLGFSAPPSKEQSHVDISSIQKLLDKSGPVSLSSDPKENPKPVYVSKIMWKTNFKHRHAIADQGFVRLCDHKGDAGQGGVVFFVGDASHIHSPAGGQGMNMGIIDAFTVANNLMGHISSGRGLNDLTELQSWAACRRKRALQVIRLTKQLLGFIMFLMSDAWFGMPRLLLGIFGLIPYVRYWVAWRLSGLEDNSRFGI